MKTPILRRKLILESRERQPDGAGGFTGGWVERGTLWAEVKPLSGRIGTENGASLSRHRYHVVLRAAPAGAPSRPRPDQRLRDGSRLFRVDAVSEADSAGLYLCCTVTEEVAA